jgi:FKBP-type peptidyl-prolyl cis-trans isomerase FkpA
MNLKKILTNSLMLAFVAVFIFSCDMINYPGFKKTKSGIYYKIHTDNNKDTTGIRNGSIVTMTLKYGLKDSTLFDSKDVPQPVMIPVTESQYEGDFFEGLRLLKQGDSATFILKAGPLFTKTFGQPAVPEFMTDESEIYFDIVVEKVQTQEQIEMETQIQNMEMEKEEMAKLESYVLTNNITAKPSSNGVYFIETKKGNGKVPVDGGYASAHYTVYMLGGEKLFSTYDRSEPIDFKVGSQFENRGFQEVITMMKEGGKANAIVPSSMAFGAQGAGDFVPPFSTLYYEIELVKVLSDAEWQKKQADKEAKKQADKAKNEQGEAMLIEKYMKDNNITPTMTLPSGLIYVEKQAGIGPKPVAGKKVKVQYTGKLLDGTKFDSSLDHGGEPLEFPIGQRAVIEGWDQGIALMSQGTKALLIIPSRLAYKERGNGNTIPPNTPLVFEVELVEIEK